MTWTCNEDCNACLYAETKYGYVCTAVPQNKATCASLCEYCTYGTRRIMEYYCKLKHTTIKVR